MKQNVCCGPGAASAHPELQQTYLEERHIDATGPQAGMSFLIGNYLDGRSFMFFLQHADAHWLTDPSRADRDAAKRSEQTMDPKDPSYIGPRLLCVKACRVVEGNRLDGVFGDLTALLQEGVLHWVVLEGHWRIFILYTLKIGVGRTGYFY